MTTIYFIRHAESDHNIHQDDIRPLTQKGWESRKIVTEFLSDKNINIALSSPYKRSVDTISDFTEKHNLEIGLIDDFRERRVDSVWIEDFWEYIEKQWEDFDYKFTDGECLREVRERNIKALVEVLKKYKDKNIIVGTHGTALSQIIHHYDNSYGYDDFMSMVKKMPWCVKLVFDEDRCVDIEKIDLY